MKNIEKNRRVALHWLLLVLAVAPLSMGARGCKKSDTDGSGGEAGSGSSTAGTDGGGGESGSGAGNGGAGNAAGSGGGGCVVGDKTYADGDAVPSIDGCNECGCNAGSVVCTLKYCIGEPCGGLQGLACKDDEYCNFKSTAACGAADQLGNCWKKPEACTKEHVPVCGCDDKTYGNDCEARRAGVSVAATGACGSGNATCKNDDDCPQPSCACLDENDDGICENHCPSFGCRDGQCVDVSQRHCGGLLGAQCLEGEVCHYAVDAICGAADATGLCEPKPDFCTKEYVPVCGCDGETYGNECEALRAGTSAAKLGACK